MIQDTDNPALFKNFVHHAPFPMVMVKIAKTEAKLQVYIVVYANRAFLQILGKKKLKPSNFHTFFGQFKGVEIKNIASVAKQGVHNTATVVSNYKDNFYKITFNKLSEAYLSVVLEDITEKQHQKIVLAEKKRQLTELYKIANLGYWVESYKKGKHIWSDNIYHLLGITDSEMDACFDNYLTFVHENDREKLRNDYALALKNKKLFESNHKIFTKSGDIRNVVLRFYTDYDTHGKALQSVGILQDITDREKIQRKLKISETIFQSVFEHAPIAIVLVNNKMQPVFSNHQFSDITGYSVSEIVKKQVKVFTHPEDYKYNEKQYLKLFNREIDEFSVTKRYIKKSGLVIWVKVTVSAIAGFDDENRYAIAMVQDISSEKTATEALIKSEYNYRTLIESATEGIGLFNRDFKPIIYNTAMYKMLGYTMDDYLKIDHKNFQLFHPDDKKEAEQAYIDVLDGKRIQNDHRVKQKSGKYLYCSISYIPVYHDEKPAILIFRRDISKRKAAELQNDEYRLFLETIMDNLPVSFFAKTTPDFRYLYWNKTMERLSGIPAEQAIGQTDAELPQFKQQAKHFLAEDKKLSADHQKIEIDHEQLDINGKLRHLHTIKTLHQPNVGTPLILGLSVDVTELNEAKKQVEQSTYMLKEAQKIAKLGYWEYDVVKDLFFDNMENRQILGTQDLPYFLNRKQLLALIFPPDYQNFLKIFSQSIAKNIEGSAIIRLKNKDGVKHVSLNFKPITNNNSGKVVKLRGISLDITRIKKSEIKLKESESKLKQAEHIAKIGYWDFDYNTHKSNFSDEIWHILEIPKKEEPHGFTTFLNHVYDADKFKVAKLFQKSKTETKPFNFEFRIVTETGKSKYIKAIGTFVRNGDNVLVKSLGTFQDITGTKKIEIDLLDRNVELYEIQKAAKLAYVDFELGKAEYKLSKSVKYLLDTNQDLNPFTGADYNSYIYFRDRRTISKTHQKALKTHTPYSVKYRIITTTDKIKEIHERCDFYTDNITQKIHCRRIFIDITDLVKKDRLTVFNNKRDVISVASFCLDKHDKILGLSIYDQEFLALSKYKNLNELLDAIKPDDRLSTVQIIRKIQEQQITLSGTFDLNINDRYYTVTLKGEKNKRNQRLNFELYDNTTFRVLEKAVNSDINFLKTFADNSMFAALILTHGKHQYVNKKWCELTGINADKVVNKATLEQIYSKESVQLLNSLFKKWDAYNLKEFTNEIRLKPINAPQFTVDVFIKEIIYNSQPSFLIMAYPVNEK